MVHVLSKPFSKVCTHICHFPTQMTVFCHCYFCAYSVFHFDFVLSYQRAKLLGFVYNLRLQKIIKRGLLILFADTSTSRNTGLSSLKFRY